ncbi:MAG: ABC transporter ATP-binding protein [bacterium]|nr:ABC transporter ATP-binding protein [bacterium]
MAQQKTHNQTPRVRFGSGGGRLTGETARDTRRTIIRLLGFVKPFRWRLANVTWLVIVGTLADLAGPALLGFAIDRHLTSGNARGLMWTVAAMSGIYAAGGLALIFQRMVMVDIAQRLMADIRAELFSHLQRLSMAYHDHHKTGDLMSRLTNDTETINQVLSNGLIDFVGNILLLGGIMISMFFLNWRLALAMLVILPLMLCITGQITRRTRLAFRAVQRHQGDLNAFMEENIAGVRVVQAFARTSETVAEFKRINAAYRKAGTQAESITAALGPMFTTMSTLTITATALIGGRLALRGAITVGVIATFIVYIMKFFRPMRTLAMLYNQLQSALAGSERIFEVLDAEVSVQDIPTALPLSEIKGEVIFDRVTFAYEEGKPVLNDISLSASPGETIALVGPTGAGKTTIVKLLSRFYDVNSGTIGIDRQDIGNIRQKSLRKQLGIVLQDTFLFSGSVMENIRYGRLDATDDDVAAAAKLANADHFIHLLPQGYDTQVSEQGNNFSQGQRQLLAIARAVLADPRILILDEATSSVDTRTEMHIQDALLRLMEGRTAFVIAHRLSTIRKADKVLVIHKHHIIEQGTHAQLLEQRGFYHNLYMVQHRLPEK